MLFFPFHCLTELPFMLYLWLLCHVLCIAIYCFVIRCNMIWFEVIYITMTIMTYIYIMSDNLIWYHMILCDVASHLSWCDVSSVSCSVSFYGLFVCEVSASPPSLASPVFDRFDAFSILSTCLALTCIHFMCMSFTFARHFIDAQCKDIFRRDRFNK